MLSSGRPKAATSNDRVLLKTPGGLEQHPHASLRDSRHVRWTGETQWANPVLPAALNSQLKVFESKPAAIKAGEIDPQSKDVHLKGDLTVGDLASIGKMPLEKLEMSNAKFPAQWDSSLLQPLSNLKYLSINGGNNFNMTDQMAGISKLPQLETLSLHRAEFMNNDQGASYANLAKMGQLKHLDLDRTITAEKAPGEATNRELADGRQIRQVTKLDPVVVDSLTGLIDKGQLQSLSLRWCTGLSEADRAKIQASAAKTGCEVTFG